MILNQKERGEKICIHTAFHRRLLCACVLVVSPCVQVRAQCVFVCLPSKGCVFCHARQAIRNKTDIAPCIPLPLPSHRVDLNLTPSSRAKQKKNNNIKIDFLCALFRRKIIIINVSSAHFISFRRSCHLCRHRCTPRTSFPMKMSISFLHTLSEMPVQRQANIASMPLLPTDEYHFRWKCVLYLPAYAY